MNPSIFSASAMEADEKEALRWRPREGANCRIDHPDPDRTVISADVSSLWQHPFQVTARFEGAWRATVRPGFVNGRDVTIDGVELTADTAPALSLHFRNPLTAGGVAATDAGDVYTLPGEGYPPYFERVGVRPAARDSRETESFAPDPARTRALRACDIALITPRISTRSEVQVDAAPGDGQIVTITTALANNAARSAASRYRLAALPRWREQAEPSALDRMLGIAAEPETDEIRIATVWLVSPPDTAPEAEPDASWTPYVQHAVFWNLFHASRNLLPIAQFEPLKLTTGLGLGVADGLFQSLLEPVNSALQAIQNFFAAADFKGRFWTC